MTSNVSDMVKAIEELRSKWALRDLTQSDFDTAVAKSTLTLAEQPEQNWKDLYETLIEQFDELYNQFTDQYDMTTEQISRAEKAEAERDELAKENNRLKDDAENYEGAIHCAYLFDQAHRYPISSSAITAPVA